MSSGFAACQQVCRKIKKNLKERFGGELSPALFFYPLVVKGCKTGRVIVLLSQLEPVFMRKSEMSLQALLKICILFVFSVRAYLDALVQTLQGVDVQSFLAGLQTGDDFLALDGPWSDGQP